MVHILTKLFFASKSFSIRRMYIVTTMMYIQNKYTMNTKMYLHEEYTVIHIQTYHVHTK